MHDGDHLTDGAARDVIAANAAAALHQRQNDVLVRRVGEHGVLAPTALGVGRGTTVDGLVDLDHAASTTQGRHEPVGAHGLTDAMRHEPCRLDGDPKHAVQLVAADALLAGAQQGDRLEPHPQGDMAVLEDGADLDGVGLAAVPALVDADPGRLALQLGGAIQLSTARANGAVRPQMGLDPLVCLLLIPEAFV